MGSIQNGLVVVGGDFNFPDWDWKKRILKENTQHVNLHLQFSQALDDHSLVQLVEVPTRINNTLDLLLTNKPSLVNRLEVIPGISDHDIVFAELEISPCRKKQKLRSIPLYRNADWDSLAAKIDKSVKSVLEQEHTESSEDLWGILKQGIKEGIKLYIPHKVRKPKNSQPWINTVIKKMMKRRDRMYKAYKKSKDQSFAKKFKSLKQEIQKQTRRAYWTYVEKLFTPSEDDHEYSATKRFWSCIKHRKTENNGIS